jgi:hypothetical protein
VAANRDRNGEHRRIRCERIGMRERRAQRPRAHAQIGGRTALRLQQRRELRGDGAVVVQI